MKCVVDCPEPGLLQIPGKVYVVRLRRSIFSESSKSFTRRRSFLGFVVDWVNIYGTFRSRVHLYRGRRRFGDGYRVSSRPTDRPRRGRFTVKGKSVRLFGPRPRPVHTDRTPGQVRGVSGRFPRPKKDRPVPVSGDVPRVCLHVSLSRTVLFWDSRPRTVRARPVIQRTSSRLDDTSSARGRVSKSKEVTPTVGNEVSRTMSLMDRDQGEVLVLVPLTYRGVGGTDVDVCGSRGEEDRNGREVWRRRGT